MLFICTFLSCKSQEERILDEVLIKAGDNRHEFKKVLDHYRNEPMKEKAARFLIKNMLGHERYDSSVVCLFQSMYDKHRMISESYDWEISTLWREEIDSCWKQDEKRLLTQLGPQQKDLHVIRADQLIKEIDLAFTSWQENIYTHSGTFEDFCSYILPYRQLNRLCLDDSRSLFYAKHKGCFADSTIHFKDAVDSLLIQYKDLKHFNYAAESMPVLSTKTFEQIKRGSCNDKTCFNIQLLSALGMAVATDFVPNWGNRSGNHSWNALIINDSTYPFEPFWDEDRWKYKDIYNNRNIDRIWGKFRLPKVYRRMYEHNLKGPLVDKNVDRLDIPSNLQSPWNKDVSDQYFATTDVQVKLPKDQYKDKRYCYLCVFDHKQWIPVQWGKIGKDGTVVFEKMGRDIVYLPAYCNKGIMEPALSPFLLRQDGTCEILTVRDEKTDIMVRHAKPYLDKEQIAKAKKWLVGSRLLGYNQLDGPSELIYEWTDDLDMWNNTVYLSGKQSYRYLRLIPSSDSIALSDLSLEVLQNDCIFRIPNIRVTAENLQFTKVNERLEMLVDSYSATGFCGVFKDRNSSLKGILLDLGRQYTLQSLSFVPYVDSDLEEGLNVEFYYWENGWISVGKKAGTGEPLVFENVPTGTIYRVKRPYIAEQIFIYRNGLVEWR